MYLFRFWHHPKINLTILLRRHFMEVEFLLILVADLMSCEYNGRITCFILFYQVQWDLCNIHHSCLMILENYYFITYAFCNIPLMWFLEKSIWIVGPREISEMLITTNSVFYETCPRGKIFIRKAIFSFDWMTVANIYLCTPFKDQRSHG
jgi:hypothetical protein